MLNKKRAGLTALLFSAALLLSGCTQRAVSSTQAPSHGPYGWINRYLGVPMQHLMEWLAHHLGNNYGWAIIVIVIIVRTILLPLMMSQMKKSTLMQERMQMIQPQMRAIQAELKAAKTPEEQAAANQKMMQLYRDNNISMTGGIGCLPLLIQLPVFTGLYDAVRYSPELSHATFMGIQLGKPSMLLAILSLLAYLFQSWLSLAGVSESQRRQMRAMMIFSPLMIFFICLSSSAGLGLYFFIGGIFAILQTWLINAYRPRLRKQIKEEAKNRPQSTVVSSQQTTQPTNTNNQHQDNVNALKHSNTQKAQPQSAQSANKKRRNRNAGKQHHRK